MSTIRDIVALLSALPNQDDELVLYNDEYGPSIVDDVEYPVVHHGTQEPKVPGQTMIGFALSDVPRASPPRRRFSPVHPGEIMRTEFVFPHAVFPIAGPIDAREQILMGIAEVTGIDRAILRSFLRGELLLTDTQAVTLSKYLSLSDDYIGNLQERYRAEMAKEAGR